MSARKIPLRLAVFGAALLLLLFFSNDFGLIDIQKTAVVAAIVIHLVRNKKKGKSSCGCGCGGCPMNGSCHSSH